MTYESPWKNNIFFGDLSRPTEFLSCGTHNHPSYWSKRSWFAGARGEPLATDDTCASEGHCLCWVQQKRHGRFPKWWGDLKMVILIGTPIVLGSFPIWKTLKSARGVNSCPFAAAHLTGGKWYCFSPCGEHRRILIRNGDDFGTLIMNSWPSVGRALVQTLTFFSSRG